MVKRIYNTIMGFLDRMAEDDVGPYAAFSTLFLIMSSFPLAMLIFTIIRYTPITEEFLIGTVDDIMPNTLLPIAHKLINEMYSNASGTIISVTAIFTLWSASKGIMSMIQGFENIFRVEKKQNYFILRFLSLFYTLIFVVGVVLVLVLMVFGNSLLELVKNQYPMLSDIVSWIMEARLWYVPIVLYLVFVSIYMFTNDKKYSMLSMTPGAVFSAIGWVAFSFFYSIYIDNFAGKSYVYGSLTTLVLAMLWIYICIYILFIGAEINVYFRDHMIKVRAIVREKKNTKKLQKEQKVD